MTFGPVTAGAVTYGHRFLAPGPIEVRGFEDYRQKLEAAYVELDGAERERRIAAGADRLAHAAQLRVRHDPGLLGELAGLVEWPVPLLGRIEQRFMDLPQEVLVTSMRQHQKYLALEDGEGRLAARFVIVANLCAEDDARDRRRQRARAARQAVGREVLLGSGPQGDARQPRAGARWHGVPRQARLARRQGAPARGAGAQGSRTACPAPMRRRRGAPPPCARPIWSPRWSASFRNSRASWGVITLRMQANPTASPRRSPSTTRRRARTIDARPRRSAW